MIVAGIDEAGYGPLLGPMVIASCTLRVPDEASPDGRDLWRALADCVVRPRQPPRRAARGRRRGGRLPVGDSKLIYNTTVGPGTLERSALALVGWTAGRPVRCADDLCELTLSASCRKAFAQPWHLPEHDRFPLSRECEVPVPPLAPRRRDVVPVALQARLL